MTAVVIAVLAVGAYGEELPENVIAKLGLGRPGILAVSPDGRKLAMSNNLGTRVFDIDGSNSITMTDQSLDHIVFSPDGTLIGGCGETPGITGIWEVESGRSIDLDHSYSADFSGFSSDGKLFFTVYRDNVSVWEIDTGQRLDQGHYPYRKGGEPDAMAVSKTHSSLAAIARNDTILVLDVRRLQTYTNCIEHDKGTTCKGPYYTPIAKLSPGKRVGLGGSLVASADTSNTVRVWNLYSNYFIRSIQHPTRISAIAVTQEGEIVIADKDGAVLETGQRLAHSGIRSMSVLDDGTLATVGAEDVAFWNTGTGNLIQKIEWINQSVSGQITSVKFSPDGKTFASVDMHGVLQLWDLDTRQLQKTFRINEEETDDWYFPVVRFSPDGRTIASIWDGDTVILRDLSTGQIVVRVRYPDNVRALEFSPGGEMLAVGGRFDGVDLLDVFSGDSIGNLECGKTATLAFSPGGDMIARGYDRIFVWKLPSRELIYDLAVGYEAIALKFSPEGRYLAAGEYYGNILMYDISSGKNLYPWRKKFFGGSYCSLDFTADGLLLISGSGSSIRFWNAYNGTLIKKIHSGDYSVRTLDISPDGGTMVSGDLGKTILLWRIPSVFSPIDFNADNRVDLADFFLFIDGLKANDLRYDMDDDGKVGYTDYYEFRDAFRYHN